MKVEFKQEKKVNPTSQDGFNVNYAPAKRVAFKARWYMLLFLVMSPIIIFAWYFFSERVLIRADGILTSEPITIISRADGLIDKVFYQPGEKVEPLVSLFQLSSPVLSAELEHTHLTLDRLRTRQEKSQLHIESLHKRKVKLYTDAIEKNKEFTRDMTAAKYQSIMPLVNRLELHLTKLKIDSEDIESEIGYQLALAQHDSGSAAKIILDLEKELSITNAEIGLLHLTSSVNATVNEVFVRKGQFVTKNTPMMSLSNRKQPVVHVYVDPKNAEYTTIGNTVTVILPDNTEYQGEVRVPSKIADKIPSILSGPFQATKAAIKVQVDIDEPIENFVEGLPVKVRYHHKNILLDVLGRILTW